jgi:hypothetical protein
MKTTKLPKTTLTVLAAAVTVLAAPGNLQAALVNPSFEDPVFDRSDLF